MWSNFFLEKPKTWLTDNYILGKWEENHIEVGGRGWDTISPWTSQGTQKPELLPEKQGVESHTGQPDFCDIHLRDKGPIYLALKTNKSCVLRPKRLSPSENLFWKGSYTWTHPSLGPLQRQLMTPKPKVKEDHLHILKHWSKDCCCSVTKSCPILCDPMDCSTPGLRVLHHLLGFVQVHIHWVSDAIQPSHPL